MKTLRKRAIAKAARVKYFKRSDGCYCLAYYAEGFGVAHVPYFPEFPDKIFLRRLKEITQ